MGNYYARILTDVLQSFTKTASNNLNLHSPNWRRQNMKFLDWSCRLLHWPAEAAIWVKLGRIVLANKKKKKLEKIFRSFFFSIFQTKGCWLNLYKVRILRRFLTTDNGSTDCIHARKISGEFSLNLKMSTQVHADIR